jgi:SMC interacting uncharacterized protein involved in chromosome segregation
METNSKETTKSKITLNKDIERLRLDIVKKESELESLRLELGRIVIKLENMKDSTA